MNIKKYALSSFMFFLTALGVNAQKAPVPKNVKEKTAFQTGSAWRPEIDVRSDIAIVYGAQDHHNMSFADRVKSWRDRGYQTHFMTGIAWGEYGDYFSG